MPTPTLLLLAALLAEPASAALPLPPPPAAMAPPDASAGGRVTGTVTFAGKVRRGTIPVEHDADVCGARVASTAVRVGRKRGLSDVAIEVLAPAARPSPAAQARIVLDHGRCQFLPAALAVPVGTRLVLRNGDPVLHSFRATREGGDEVFHYALPVQGMTVPRNLDAPGLLTVGCEAGHEWSRALVLVSTSPFLAVSGADGRFVVADVPPGTWPVHAWHVELGRLDAAITVVAGQEATLALRYP
jgi:hypothetical protein